METCYISFDLETLGGNTSDFTMINAGFVAYTEKREKLGELSVNFKPLRPDEETKKWFNSTPKLKEAYAKCSVNPLEPKDGMIVIRDWIHSISKGRKPLLVCYPTIFDGSILYHYWFTFLGHPNGGRGPGFTVVDIRSYASGKLNISYFDAAKEKALAPFRPKDKIHTHTGLDDAEEQMELFFNIRDDKRVN